MCKPQASNCKKKGYERTNFICDTTCGAIDFYMTYHEKVFLTKIKIYPKHLIIQSIKRQLIL